MAEPVWRCQGCASELLPPKNPKSPRKWCSDRCRYRAYRKAKADPAPYAERLCVRCGVNIDHRDIRSRHCGPRCRDRDQEGSVIGSVRDCAHCGQEFTPSKNPHIYCSKACRDRADLERNRAAYRSRGAVRRARERGARVGETFTHEQVFDRDGWICQLCLTPINWTLSGRDPLAPALDHIVPISKGGTHSLDNVWASHFGCNARKGAREGAMLLAPPGADVSDGVWGIFMPAVV